MNTLFEVKNLSVVNNNIKILKNIDFKINKGEILGIIGESGCGKSTLIRAVSRMMNEEEKITDGRVLFNGIDLLTLCDKEMKKIRGKGIGIVFQNPASTFNPVVKIGKQFREAINVHRKINKKQCIKECAELMKKLNLNDAECILDSYTFELSGGMSQRTAIALAMILKPKLLICDEPTSALDVTVQAQVVKELKGLREDFNTSMIVVAHSIGVISNMADKVAVMYAGEIVEYGKCSEILNNPMHPYTKALINAVPVMNGGIPKPIKGNMHSFKKEIKGCCFAERCELYSGECVSSDIEFIKITDEHFVKCQCINIK
ncbi:ABC transporter ATP-binding protein [uncultured Clostridium sp.]|uniref:ABC transporter ATP-binding protein n=1 Tax=uncultured Clostridium sp. TaxID=59620 RepID=UPI0026002562|nr:ABC transporter ATP-binding protein [uncultured Clostridium sp.]